MAYSNADTYVLKEDIFSAIDTFKKGTVVKILINRLSTESKYVSIIDKNDSIIHMVNENKLERQ